MPYAGKFVQEASFVVGILAITERRLVNVTTACKQTCPYLAEIAKQRTVRSSVHSKGKIGKLVAILLTVRPM
jgi:hypothetical protein